MPLVALSAIVMGCAQDPGEITRDTEPFGMIAPTASLSLLGTEPFWGIEIVPEGAGYTGTYSSPENIDGTSFSAARFAGNNGIGFSGELDGKNVQIALTPGECGDGMSDRTYPYFAIVQIGDSDLRGCAYTSDEPFTGDAAP